MLYHFELQMAGVILLTAMAVGGISLWLKRRRERNALVGKETTRGNFENNVSENENGKNL